MTTSNETSPLEHLADFEILNELKKGRPQLSLRKNDGLDHSFFIVIKGDPCNPAPSSLLCEELAFGRDKFTEEMFHQTPKKRRLCNTGEDGLYKDISHSIFGLENSNVQKYIEVNHIESKLLPEVTEEIILSQFYFEDEDLAIVDEEDVKGEKKILVRQNEAKGFLCPLFCNFTCSEQPKMIAHLIKHKKRVPNTFNEEITYKCPMCPCKFVMHSSFVVHIASHRKVPNLICSVCSVVQPTLTALKNHVIKKHSQVLRCCSCPYRTKNVKTFNAHKRKCFSKALEKSLKCHFSPCPFVGTSVQTLKTHEWIQHQLASNKVKSYKCEAVLCNFETCQLDMLNVHKQSHIGEEMLCSLCFFRTYQFYVFCDHLLEHINLF